jgi:hypothetical protein
MPTEIEQVRFEFSQAGADQVERAYGGIEDASKAAAEAGISGITKTNAALEDLQKTQKSANALFRQHVGAMATLSSGFRTAASAAMDVASATAAATRSFVASGRAAELGSASVDLLTSSYKKARKGMKALSGAGEELVAGLGRAAQVGGEVLEFATAGEQVQSLAKQFTALGGTGQDLERLRDATAGLVDTATLQRLANQANLAGISLKSTIGLLNVSAGAALQQGADFEDFAERAIVGVSRRSAQRLDDLGIILGNTGQIYSDFAQEAGKNVGALTKDEQTLAVVNDILNTSTKQLAAVQDAQGQVIARAGVNFKNLRVELQQAVATSLKTSGALDIIAASTPRLQAGLEGLAGAAGPALGTAFEALTGLIPLVEAGFQNAASTLQIVGPLLSEVTQVAGPLFGAFRELTGPLREVAEAARPIIATLGTGLIDVIKTVSPLVGDLAKTFAGILTELQPVVSVVVQLLSKALRPLVGIVRSLLPLLTAAAKILSAGFSAVEPVLSVIFALLEPLLDLTGLWTQGIVTLIEVALTPFILALEAVGTVLGIVADGITSGMNAIGVSIRTTSEEARGETAALGASFTELGSKSSFAAEQVALASQKIDSSLRGIERTGALATTNLIKQIQDTDKTFSEFEARLSTAGIVLTAEQMRDLAMAFGETSGEAGKAKAQYNEVNLALGVMATTGGRTTTELARMSRALREGGSAAKALEVATAFAGVEIKGLQSSLDLVANSLKLDAEAAKFGSQEVSKLADSMAAVTAAGGNANQVFTDLGAGLVENVEDISAFTDLTTQTKAGIFELEEALLPTIDAVQAFRQAELDLFDAQQALLAGDAGARAQVDQARQEFEQAAQFVQEMGATQGELSVILDEMATTEQRLVGISSVVARHFELSNEAAQRAIINSDTFFGQLIAGIEQVEAIGEQARAEGLLRDKAAEAQRKKRRGKGKQIRAAREKLILEARLEGLPEIERKIEEAALAYQKNMKIAGKSVEAQIAAQQLNFLQTVPLAARAVEIETRQLLGRIGGTFGAFGDQIIAKGAAGQIADSFLAIPANLSAVFSGDAAAANEAIIDSWLAGMVDNFRQQGESAAAVFATPALDVGAIMQERGAAGLAAAQTTIAEFQALEQQFGETDPATQAFLEGASAIEQTLLGLSEGFEAAGQSILDYNDAQAQLAAGAITASEAATLQGRAIKQGVSGSLRASKTVALGFIKDTKKRAITQGLFEAAESIASFAVGDLIGGGLHAAASAKYFALSAAGGGSVSAGAGAGAGAGAAAGGGGGRDERQRRELTAAPIQRRTEQQTTTINMFSSLDTRPPGEIVNDALNRFAADNTGAQGAAGMINEQASAGGM